MKENNEIDNLSDDLDFVFYETFWKNVVIHECPKCNREMSWDGTVTMTSSAYYPYICKKCGFEKDFSD